MYGPVKLHEILKINHPIWNQP